MSFDRARALIRKFTGNSYTFGLGVLAGVGEAVAAYGHRGLLVSSTFAALSPHRQMVGETLAAQGIAFETIRGAAPNAPREDLERVAGAIRRHRAEVVVSLGGGSTIDCTKAAIVLACQGGGIDDYFGTGLVSAARTAGGADLLPHVAIQTAASSAAHLTKYANITDLRTHQKKLVVDLAIVPHRAFFDYSVTLSAPASLTLDGALDGISHSLEVLYSAAGKADYAQIEQVALESIRLIVQHLPAALNDPDNPHAREALGLGTDLGGYAIMLGGTNGAHLTSFSLVDILSHGRACGLLNPYYTVFFAPAVQEPLRQVGRIFAEAGYADPSTVSLSGRALGVAVAQAMLAFEKRLGCPATLAEVTGFSPTHVDKILTAAKDPQLRMKLENMPVPLKTELVDEYMGAIIEAAITGDLDLIKTL